MGTVAEALQRVPATAPYVDVLDVRLPDGTAIEVCRDIGSSMPHLKSLMLTSFNDDEALFDAIMAGAPGYALRSPRIRPDRERPPGRCRQSLLDPVATARVLDVSATLVVRAPKGSD